MVKSLLWTTSLKRSDSKNTQLEKMARSTVINDLEDGAFKFGQL